MTDYEPLDLAGYRNAPGTLFAPAPSPGRGRRLLRGIPFELGPDGPDGDVGHAWLGFGAAFQSETTRLPIGRPVRTLIVAHALVASGIPDGGAVGRLVAEYVFHLADGRALTTPIRELFEIGVVPYGPMTGTRDGIVSRIAAHPWLAEPDRYDSLHPRSGGPWELSGRRMMECDQGFSAGFKLWTWHAPHAAVVEALEVRAAGPAFAIGGITAGHVDEHPFARTGREPVLIELLDGRRASGPASMSVRVDRGVATYAWPAVPEPPDHFLAADVVGEGEPIVADTGMLAAEVAAVPSATVEVLEADDVLGAVRWRDVIENGRATDGRVRVTWVDRARTWVHTTVVEDRTGKPIPCRIHFRSPSGIPWQPHGHAGHVNADLSSWHIDVGGDVRLGRVSYAVIDGRCQGWLPQGDVLVEVTRGFEYEPLRAHLHIAPGQRELRLALHRWADLRAEGWASGDTHVHFLSVDGSHLEARAEDLHVVNLLQAQFGHLYTNTESFTGRPSVDADGESIVFVGSENRQHVLGHLGLLGLRQPVMPWSSDGPGEAEIGGTMEATLSHWADEGRAAGASLVTAPHFGYPNGELPALIATGRVDALEMVWQGRYFHEEYYRYLNAGYRLPLVGGTDKMSNEVPVGLYRTYARLEPDEPLTYDTWTRAVAAGRTFLSAGPIVRLAVEGAGVGDTVRLPRGGGIVEVYAVAEAAAPIHVLQLVVAGKVMAEATATGGARSLVLRERIEVAGNTWIAARAGGPGYYGSRLSLCPIQRGVFAHTSPVYIACGEGAWTRDDPATVEYMATRIEGVLAYIRHTAATSRLGGGGHVHTAPDHRAWLEAPLHEALHALADRRHPHGTEGPLHRPL